MRKIVIIYQFFLFSCFLYAKPVTIHQQNFTFIADSKDSIALEQIINWAHESKILLDNFYSKNVLKDITIIYAGSEERFNYIVRGKLPDWSGAVAYPAHGKIVLKKPRDNRFSALRETIVHELSHIYLYENSYDTYIPLWFNEGLAMYLSGDDINITEGLSLSNALASGNILFFDEMDSLLRLPRAQAELAYLQSLSVIQFIALEQGEDKLKMITEKISDGINFDQAFLQILNQDLENFEYDWYAFIKKRYKWMIVLNFDNLLWLILIIIVIIAYISIKIKNYRKLNSWEE